MISLERFLELAVASRLVSRSRLNRAIDAFRAADPDSDAESLPPMMEWLVRTGVLTQWQCDKLLGQKYKGFYLGRYRLMGHLANGKAGVRYAAVNIELNERVELIVCPTSRGETRYFVIRPGALLDEDVDGG